MGGLEEITGQAMQESKGSVGRREKGGGGAPSASAWQQKAEAYPRVAQICPRHPLAFRVLLLQTGDAMASLSSGGPVKIYVDHMSQPSRTCLVFLR